jgi:RNA polymerase sigma-70 factor (family 1)
MSEFIDEKDLKIRVAAGDEKAFSKLYLLYAQLLRSHIFRLTESMALADEVVQDVFLKVWNNRENLEKIQNFGGYLFVLSKNLSIDLLRKHVRQTILIKKWEDEQQKSTESAELSIEEEKSYYILLDEAIDRLPAQQQKAYILSRHQHLKYSEIAEEMNISKETVKSYLQLAVSSISNYLKKNGKLIGIFFFNFL